MSSRKWYWAIAHARTGVIEQAGSSSFKDRVTPPRGRVIVHSRRAFDPNLYLVKNGVLMLKPVETVTFTVEDGIATLHAPEGTQFGTIGSLHQVRLKSRPQTFRLKHPALRLLPVTIPAKHAH